MNSESNVLRFICVLAKKNPDEEQLNLETTKK